VNDCFALWPSETGPVHCYSIDVIVIVLQQAYSSASIGDDSTACIRQRCSPAGACADD